MTEIEKKINKLRQEWRENPSRRDIIEIQVRALKLAMTAGTGRTFAEEAESIGARKAQIQQALM